MSIIVYGSPAGGMDQHGQALLHLFGCTSTAPVPSPFIYEAFLGKTNAAKYAAGACLFTTDQAPPAALEKAAAACRRIYSWDEAVAMLKGAAAAPTRAEG